jgi:1,4-dihydroxy-2-naphthoyl-CoA hydrolase
VELSPELIYEMAPFARTLGVEFPRLDPDEVHARLAVDHRLSTLGGGLHGGAVMSLCDLAGAVCAGLHVRDGAGWTTVESTTYFPRAVRGRAAGAVARPVKVGAGLINVDVDVYEDGPGRDRRHCARTSQLLLVQAGSGDRS